MTARDKATLKSYFETNDTPSESQFADQIDTFFGEWVDYATGASIVGWASYVDRFISYKMIGTLVFVNFAITGISNSTTTTFNLPAPEIVSGSPLFFCLSKNGDNPYVAAQGQILGSLVTLAATPNGNPFAATGTKQVFGQFFYEKA
jgi:hypothetical protein